jgi:hypothetical protein
MRQLWLMVAVGLALAAAPCTAKRIPAPKVAPVEANGLRYVAPNTDGRRGLVHVSELWSGRGVKTLTLFTIDMDFNLEQDNQWVYITKLEVAHGKLIATDERGRRYSVPLEKAVPPHVTLTERLAGTSFLRSGEALYIGQTAAGEPVSAFEKVYLKNAKGLILVKGPAGMVGHVNIDTRRKALQYVRLFTSPATVRALALPVWLEVVPTGVLSDGFVFGRKHNLFRAPYREDLHRIADDKSLSGQFGVISEEQWEASGLDSPSTWTVPQGFVVMRGLVKIAERSAWGTGIVQQVEETVTRDGHVTRRVVSKRKVPGILVRLLPEE